MILKPLPKINREPVTIVISGYAFERYTREPERLTAYLKRKLLGSGTNLEEINELADAILNRTLILVGVPDADNGERWGYIRGKRFSTPTQNVEFLGSIGQP